MSAVHGDWLCLTALELSEIALIRGVVDRVVTEQRQPALSDRRCGTISRGAVRLEVRTASHAG
jgi:hypothetical protein